MYFPDNHDAVLDQMDTALDGRNSTETGNADLWFRHFSTMVDFQIAIDDFLNYRMVNKEDNTIGFIYSLLPSPDRSRYFPYTEIKGIYTEEDVGLKKPSYS